jgi:hypothetical protein
MNRREFLSLCGLGAAGAALAPLARPGFTGKPGLYYYVVTKPRRYGPPLTAERFDACLRKVMERNARPGQRWIGASSKPVGKI